MLINFLGDSITEGAAASSQDKNYVQLVGKLLNCEVRNYGISATRIAKQVIPSLDPVWDKYFASRVADLDSKADYTIVFGGTNDYGHGDAPIGKVGDKTPDTFCGAIDDLCNELLKKFDKKQLIFILPLYRKNEDNPYGEGNKKIPSLTLQGYRDLMVEVLKKYDVDIFDVKDLMGKPEDVDLYADGLHPNDKGHLKLANLIVEHIKAK